MAKRRTHSSIDKLPADLRGTLTSMIVDGTWPTDYPGHGSGTPRYEDLVLYCHIRGYIVSDSAIGRWAKQHRTIAMLTEKREIVMAAMQSLDQEDASESQKVAVELMTAHVMSLLLGEDKLEAKEMSNIADALKNCAYVSINADKYIRSQIAAKLKVASASAEKKLTAAGVDRALIQSIIDEQLGILKS